MLERSRVVKWSQYSLAFSFLYLFSVTGFAFGQPQNTMRSQQSALRLAKDLSIGGGVAGKQFPLKSSDAFRIFVFPDTAHFLSGIYQIDDAGYVFLPIIGNVKVDSMTFLDFSHMLDSLYVPYLRNPSIRVQPLIRVSLLGGFYKPGLYYVNPSASLWEAVALAGGPVREDGYKKMRWEHNGSIVKENLLFDIEKGSSLKTLGFKSGDLLTVTRLPKLEGWELFRTDILPVLSLSVTALSATATMYFAYQAYQRGR